MTATTTAPSTTTTQTLALDHVGILAVTDGIVHYLTDCCRVSVKGSTSSPTGAQCRACRRPVDPSMGNGWLASDGAAWVAWAAAFTADAERQNPANVGNPVVASMVEAVQVQAAAHG